MKSELQLGVERKEREILEKASISEQEPGKEALLGEKSRDVLCTEMGVP